MKTINHYRVEVVDPDYAGLMGRDNTFKCSTHNVLGVAVGTLIAILWSGI
jgi:hypothetical protein